MTEVADSFDLTDEPLVPSGRMLTVAGELDIATAPELVDMLARLRHHRHAVTLDLAEVTFMDSTGLTTLMDAYMQAQQNGWSFSVRRPSPPVRRVFELAGLGRILDG